MKESDLYLPLKQFLESQRYEVKGEVGDCDVLAVRGDEVPVIVELKLSLNLKVLLQAVEPANTRRAGRGIVTSVCWASSTSGSAIRTPAACTAAPV